MLDVINKIAIYYLKPLLFIDMDDFSWYCCIIFFLYVNVAYEYDKMCKERRKLVVYACHVWHDVQKSNSPYFIDSQVLTMIIINREEFGRWSVILYQHRLMNDYNV